MDMELETVQPEAAPVEELDLRSQIEAAVSKQREAPAEEPVADEPAPGESEERKADRTRDERGRFAAKEGEPAEATQAPAEPLAKVAETPAAEPAAETVIRPPPGWSPGAKVAFDALPEEVKAAVAKREEEVNKGFAKLAEYKPLEPYAEAARSNGRSLTAVLDEVMKIDNVFIQDKSRGLQMILQRYGMDPVQVAHDLLTRSGGAPNQGATGVGQPGYQTPPAPDLSPVLAEINQLKSYIATQQQQEVQSTLTAFASDPAHRFFDNVRPQMAALIDSGQAKTLQEAYDAACWMNPEIRSLLIKQQTASAPSAAPRAAVATQARAAAKATNGAPAPGTRPGQTPVDPNMSTRDIIRAAVDTQRGRA